MKIDILYNLGGIDRKPEGDEAGPQSQRPRRRNNINAKSFERTNSRAAIIEKI